MSNSINGQKEDDSGQKADPAAGPSMMNGDHSNEVPAEYYKKYLRERTFSLSNPRKCRSMQLGGGRERRLGNKKFLGLFG